MSLDAKKHTQLREKLESEIQAGVFDNIKALENRIAELVGTGQPPAELRAQITQAYEQFALSTGEAVKPVRELATDVDEQMEANITPDDLSATDALVDGAAKSVSGVVKTGVEDMMSTLILAGAVGAGTQVLVDAARGRVSGVFMETTDPQAKKAQRKLKKLLDTGKADPEEVRGAIKNIRERLSGVNTTSSLRDLTAKSVQDTVMKFDGAYTAGKAKRAGVKRWRYDGGTVAESREWCKDHVGETYTEEEIYSLWDSDWSGKEPGDPFVVRGGYNCRHFWVPVEEDE